MKQVLNITNFGAAGLNSDILPWDLPPEHFTEFQNIRVSNGRISPFGGYQDYIQLPESFLPGYVMFLDLPENNYWIVPGRQGIWVHDGNNWFEVTPPGMGNIPSDPPFLEDLWHGCHLSRIPILNHPLWFPIAWLPQNTSNPFEEIPFRPGATWQESGERARIVRSFKQFLIAMDLDTLNYGELPDGVRWSTPADVGALPESWDELDQTNTAGLTQLGGDGGTIIDGLALRDSFVIYRERSVSVMDYVPNSPYVFRIRHQSTTFGLASPDSIMEVKGMHFFISDGDIMVNDGNKIESLIHNKIRKEFSADFNAAAFDRSFVVKNSIAAEAWFCIPTHESTHPTKAFIYNWRDDTWGVRDIPATPFADYGAKSTPQLTWSSIQQTWEKANLLWNRREVSPSDDSVIAVVKPNSEDNPGPSGYLRYLDLHTGEESQYVSLAERVGFALGGTRQVTTITSVYPHAEGPGGFWIRLGSMDWPGAPVRWKEAVYFDPTTMRKVDIRTTGELHCFRILDDNTDEHWSLSGMEVEYTQAGLR